MNKEQINKDIEQALQLIEKKYSTTTHFYKIVRPTLVCTGKFVESKIIDNIVNESYNRSKCDGMLNKELSLLALKYLIKDKLTSFITLMKLYEFDVFYSDDIDYKYLDGSLDIPRIFYIDNQIYIDKLVNELKDSGKTRIGIYSISLCSKIDEHGNFYVKTCIRIHTISDCIGMTRKINHYYNNVITPGARKNIKDIADIHRRSRTFVRLLLKNNIKVEYTKLFVPCFLVNDKPVTAMGYIIPLRDTDIISTVKLNFVDTGAKKVIISQLSICPGTVDKDWNIYLRFVINTCITLKELKAQRLDLTYTKLCDKSITIPNETTLNITITPNKSVEQIILNIKKNR